MKNRIVKILFFVYIIWPVASQAASLSLENISDLAAVDREISLQVNVDTQGQDINALEGYLILPDDLEVVNIYDNNSIVSLWVDKPKEDNGQIYFSGVMPGGFIGKGDVFKIIVRSQTPTKYDFYFNNLQAYLNDGFGTKADVSSQNFNLNIIASDEEQGIDIKVRDNIQPEDFVPIIKRLDQIENGIFFLIFETQDKGEGIDYYKVREGFGSYVLATSPYRLKNQRLDEDIFVKAVDRAGNERVVKVLSFYSKFWYQKYEIYGIIIFVIIIWLAYKKI